MHICCDCVVKHKEEVEYQKKRVSELEEPMECGHFGANLQPDDSNADVCLVCLEVADLQAELASLREVARAAERAEKHWPAINKRRFALINKKFSDGLSETETAELNGLQEVGGILVDALLQYRSHESKWGKVEKEG